MLEKPAVPLDGAVAHFKGFGEAGEGVFEGELLVKPARQLGRVAHHQVIIELAVSHIVDAGGHERVKLYDPFGLWILPKPATGDSGQVWQVGGTAEGLAPIARHDVDNAAGEDVKREDDLLVGAGMSALFELLPQGIKRENHPAAVIGLVEIAGLLLCGQLAQCVLNELLVGAGIKIAVHAVQIFDARGREDADQIAVLVSEFGFVLFEKMAVNTCLGHGLAADGVTGHVIP